MKTLTIKQLAKIASNLNTEEDADLPVYIQLKNGKLLEIDSVFPAHHFANDDYFVVREMPDREGDQK